METADKFVIPTLSRAKISHLLSYPIGAERISEALAATPNNHQLKLHFFAGMGDGLRTLGLNSGTGYEFLRVEYLNDSVPAEKYPIWHLYPRPEQYRWEIVVQPVPRLDRHKVKCFILESALARVSEWLGERPRQTNRGSEILVFFYEPQEGTFLVQEISNLEPLSGGTR